MKALSYKNVHMESPVITGDNRSSGRKTADFFINNALYFMIFILVIYCAIKYPLFLGNFPVDLLKRTAAYVVMALGMGCVMVLGGTDLSLGRVMGFTAIISASLLEKASAPAAFFPNFTPLPIPVVFIIVLIVGCIIGFINGFFIAKFDLHPFIVTLATQLMVYGAMLCYMNIPHGLRCGSYLTNEYKGFVTNTIKIGRVAIPNYVWYAIILVSVMWFIWNKTALGRNMFMTGSNREAAKFSGVDVFRTIIAVNVLACVFYAVNGFIEAARVGGPGAGLGNGAECDAIAACVIGGVSMVGGIGKISGIVVGVALLQLASVCLQWMSVSANLVYIIKGAIILIAVSLDMRKYIAKK